MIAVIHSFGTDVTTPGGTAEVIAFGVITAMDMAERTAWIRENLMILFMRLGAILSRSGGFVKYWLTETRQFNYRKTITPFIVGYLSGFV